MKNTRSTNAVFAGGFAIRAEGLDRYSRGPGHRLERIGYGLPVLAPRWQFGRLNMFGSFASSRSVIGDPLCGTMDSPHESNLQFPLWVPHCCVARATRAPSLSGAASAGISEG